MNENNNQNQKIAVLLGVLAAAIGVTLVVDSGNSHRETEIKRQAERYSVNRKDGANMTQAISPSAEKLTNPRLVMKTTRGEFTFELFQKDAPITSKVFLDLADRGFYDGLTFHRYEPGFLIQGGDPAGDGSGGFIDPVTKKKKTIPLEISPALSHDQAGTLGMARETGANSASSQFYVTLAAQTFLDGKYSVFGKVVEGMNTVYHLRKGDRIVSIKRVDGASN